MLSIALAAAAAYAFGAVWYMSLSRHWVAAAGVACDENGRPLNKSALPFLLSALAMLVVAAAMSHIFGLAGIAGLLPGLVLGLELGAFVALPWVVINYAYSFRPPLLTLIDGGYAVIGCGIIGAVLGN